MNKLHESPTKLEELLNINYMDIITAVRDASPKSIISAAEKIRSSAFSKERWLFHNIYHNDVIATLQAEGDNPPSRPNQLAQYIAASTVLHCSDGWKFFSCAMENLLNGDKSNTVFMAYYAQLRSLMAFFATQGIGIFNNKHYCYDNNGTCSHFWKNTHDAVRELINAWAIDNGKNISLLQILKLEGRSYSDWISGADILLGSPRIPELAKDWLTAWSIDLNVLGKDHETRNEVSYRPQGIIHKPNVYRSRSDLDLCIKTWRLSEPYSANRFAMLDQQLLRETLFTIYKHRKPTRIKFTQFVETSMINLGLGLDSELHRFLISSQTNSNNEILRIARKPASTKARGIDPIPVMCRAFLLLRIASAAVENFLEASSIDSSDLEFWWSQFGIQNGLWEPEHSPSQMSDLWADISDAIDNVDSFLEQNTSRIDIARSHSELSYELWQLKHFDKAGLWAIGL